LALREALSLLWIFVSNTSTGASPGGKFQVMWSQVLATRQCDNAWDNEGKPNHLDPLFV
jgi:hypothetical protein